jgi:hypothetical protein
MKITRSQLTQIIQEELGSIKEFEKVKGAASKKIGFAQAKASVAAGINDAERGIITAVQEKLLAAAGEGNLASSTVLKYLDKAMEQLDKIIGAEPEAAPEDAPLDEL